MNDLMVMGCSTVKLHQTNLHFAFFGSVILISPKNHGSPLQHMSKLWLTNDKWLQYWNSIDK